MSHDHPPRPPFSYRMMHAAMGPILKVLGMSCREITELSAVRLDRKLGRAEALKLRLHTAMCGLCRRLPRQFTNLHELVRHAHEHETQIPTDGPELPRETRERIDAILRTDQDGNI